MGPSMLNLRRYSPMGAWPVMPLHKREKVVTDSSSMPDNQGPPLWVDGRIRLPPGPTRSRNCLPRYVGLENPACQSADAFLSAVRRSKSRDVRGRDPTETLN